MAVIRWRPFLSVLAVVVLAVTPALLAQTKGDPAAGQAVYKAKCMSCHGASGAGDGPVGQKLKDKPKDWTKGEGLKDLSDQQLYEAVKKGGKAVGKSAAMIAFPTLSDAEVWNVLAYVKTLVKS